MYFGAHMPRTKLKYFPKLTVLAAQRVCQKHLLLTLTDAA